MIDIRTEMLLDAISDALSLPPAATGNGAELRARLERRRTVAVCAAIDHARSTGDLAEAIEELDRALHDLPLCYQPVPGDRPSLSVVSGGRA
ncbi:hypothetical protein [Nocardiopsis aegyptia]|uniref:Uncharacterized protein n=1 Tax=Nocardiopsis aegyptia TaxID=220378 RepID=A0A7Z0EQT4_9ACTN|nr:hypothetical protein [Nocardiopsis aegyptia]NYJ36036.1 hypothetical protein [Nocardiopsis aegyptia]